VLIFFIIFILVLLLAIIMCPFAIYLRLFTHNYSMFLTHFLLFLWKVLKLPRPYIFMRMILSYCTLSTVFTSIFESVKFCKTDILRENYLYTVEVWTSFEQSANTLQLLARGPNCTVTLDLENALINISRDKLCINVLVSLPCYTINNHPLTIVHVKSTRSYLKSFTKEFNVLAQRVYNLF